MQLNRGWYRCLQPRQHCLHVIDRLVHVRRGVLEDNHKDRRLAVEHSHPVNVLNAVDDLRNILNPYRTVYRTDTALHPSRQRGCSYACGCSSPTVRSCRSCRTCSATIRIRGCLVCYRTCNCRRQPCTRRCRAHRSAVRRNNQRSIRFRAEELVRCTDAPSLAVTLQVTFRLVHIHRADRRTQRFQPNAIVRQLHRVRLNPHRRFCAASAEHLPYTLHLRNLLRQNAVARVVQLRNIHRVRGQRHNQNRRVGRVDFVIAGIARQIRGQLASRRIDRGLHIARRSIHIAAQVELHGDVRRTRRRRRGHLIDACDLGKLSLQRRRHRRSHRLGIGPWQTGIRRDHRILYLRQTGYRQQLIRDRARQ